MSYYSRRKRRAFERLLEAENDYALGISKRRLIVASGIVCGLACDHVTGKLYRAFCSIVEAASANGDTDPAYVKLAAFMVIVIFILAFFMRRRCIRLKKDFEEYMGSDAVDIPLDDFFASSTLDDDTSF